MLCQSNQVRSREIDDDMDGKPDKLAFSAQVRVMCVYICARACLDTSSVHAYCASFFFVRVPLSTLGTEVLCNILEVA